MAQSHSSHQQHPRMSMHNRPNNIIHQNSETTSNNLSNNRNDSYGFVNSSAHRWQTEEPFNLDNLSDGEFDLVAFVNADSTSPMDEPQNWVPDDIEKQKTGAMFEQWQLDEMGREWYPQNLRHEHGLQNREKDEILSLWDEYPELVTATSTSDYASVPTYTGFSAMEVGNPAFGGYQHEQHDEPIYLASETRQDEYLANANSVAVVAPMQRTSNHSGASLDSLPTPTTASMIKTEMIKEEPVDKVRHFADLNKVMFNGFQKIQLDAPLEPCSGIVSCSSRASSVGSSIYTTTVVPAKPSTSTATYLETANRPPRKYRMKPDTEKQNPIYKIKRQKVMGVGWEKAFSWNDL